jgi:hypothetical protein
MTTVTNTVAANSQLLSRVTFREISDELVLALRNNLTDRRNRTTYVTETFTGVTGKTDFTFTQDLDSNGRHKIMNAKWVKIDGVEQHNYTDYLIGYRSTSPIYGKLHFWNAPAAGAVIQVYYGKTYQFIYPEAPRVDLTSNSYPRVNVQLSASAARERCVGGKVQSHDITVTITVVDETRDYVEDTIQDIKDYFTQESVKHGFYNFTFIMRPRITPLLVNGEDGNDVVYVQQVEYTIPAQYEFSA